MRRPGYEASDLKAKAATLIVEDAKTKSPSKSKDKENKKVANTEAKAKSIIPAEPQDGPQHTASAEVQQSAAGALCAARSWLQGLSAHRPTPGNPQAEVEHVDDQQDIWVPESRRRRRFRR